MWGIGCCTIGGVVAFVIGDLQFKSCSSTFILLCAECSKNVDKENDPQNELIHQNST